MIRKGIKPNGASPARRRFRTPERGPDRSSRIRASAMSTDRATGAVAALGHDSLFELENSQSCVGWLRFFVKVTSILSPTAVFVSAAV